MSLSRDAERYFNYKFLKALDNLFDEIISTKRRKKQDKKQIISWYGYPYYLHNKTWNKIKDQRKNENFVDWQARLETFGFTREGVFMETGENFFGSPLIHEFTFNEDKMEEKLKMKSEIWETILESITACPRDIVTTPSNYREGLWFFVSSDGQDIFVESGKNHSPKCKITKSRQLDKVNADAIYDLYQKRESVPSSEISEITLNSSYWFGIFENLNL